MSGASDRGSGHDAMAASASAAQRWPGADELAAALVGATGSSVRAILLYGSHLTEASPDRHSAFDFFVVVEDYGAFYAGLSGAEELHRPHWLMTRMARLLPPNVIVFTPEEGVDGIAKCVIVSRDHLVRALGPAPPDHFLLGRMVQRLGKVFLASPEDEEWIDTLLAGARGRVLEWMVPYLDAPVDAAGFGRRLLEVCYQGEFRPESRDRPERLSAAQAGHFREQFGAVLARGEKDGVLKRENQMFVLAAPASQSVRSRWRAHFRRSKVRATLRWFKHMLTFANWLPYVVRKVERHTGRPVRLTALERKLPLIFLWPRAIKVLLTRPPREISK